MTAVMLENRYNFKNLKVFVTGAEGFIGSHLTEVLVKHGARVTALVLYNSFGTCGWLDEIDKEIREEIQIEHGDVRDRKQIHSLVEGKDLIFHLAAQISVAVSVREPQFDADVNVGGALNILEGVRTITGKNVRMVYVTSGGTVYGDPEKIPVDESVTPSPLSPYGASKLAVETYLPIYQRLSDFSYSIIRLGNVYGPRQDPHGEAGVVAIFANAMLEGRSVRIFGDGKDQRDYVFIMDVIEAILRASQNQRPGPFNIGTGIGTSTNRIFEIIAHHCDYKKPPIYAPPRPGDISRISLDYGRAREELSWSPMTRLEEGLKATVAWFGR